MEKEFIPYEQALALKQLGFDEPCFKVYDNMGFLQEESVMNTCEIECDCILERCLAPLYQQAFRWFREKYELCVWVTSKTVESKTIYIVHARTIPDTIKNNLIVDVFPYATFKTYEEAELECLKKLIEIVRTNNI
jgi:hypothetical protein